MLRRRILGSGERQVYRYKRDASNKVIFATPRNELVHTFDFSVKYGWTEGLKLLMSTMAFSWSHVTRVAIRFKQAKIMRHAMSQNPADESAYINLVIRYKFTKGILVLWKIDKWRISRYINKSGNIDDLKCAYLVCRLAKTHAAGTLMMHGIYWNNIHLMKLAKMKGATNFARVLSATRAYRRPSTLR